MKRFETNIKGFAKLLAKIVDTHGDIIDYYDRVDNRYEVFLKDGWSFGTMECGSSFADDLKTLEDDVNSIRKERPGENSNDEEYILKITTNAQSVYLKDIVVKNNIPFYIFTDSNLKAKKIDSYIESVELGNKIKNIFERTNDVVEIGIEICTF